MRGVETSSRTAAALGGAFEMSIQRGSGSLGGMHADARYGCSGSLKLHPLSEVLIGDPTADFKKRTQELNLKKKQARASSMTL